MYDMLKLSDDANNWIKLLARVIIGAVFFIHGYVKFAGGGFSGLSTLFQIAGIIEVVGGVLLVLGLWTRLTALVTAVEMLVAWFYVHVPNGWNPLANNGEPAALFFAAFLLLFIHGPGEYSLDCYWCDEK